MLTREGWLASAGAVALLVAGRLLGTFELYLLGAGVGALVLVSLASVAFVRLHLSVSRAVVPPRVHAGSSARVELRVQNQSGHHTPVLRVRDAVSGTRGANLLLSPLGAHEQVRAAYQLPTEQRGVLIVGPLDVVVSDPFGLARSRTKALDTAELVVYPRIDPITPVGRATGHDSQAAIRNPNALGRVGDDFYALRPYVVGDDLRRVHWPSVARTGDLMVRQQELPWQQRTTVLLDNRPYAHHDQTFEAAVSAAASILASASTRGDQVRLCITDQSDSGFGTGRAHLDSLLHHLALARLDQGSSLQASLEQLSRVNSGGGLVLVTASIATTDLARFVGIRRRFGHVETVIFDDATAGPAPGGETSALPGLTRVSAGSTFADAWHRSHGGVRRDGSEPPSRYTPPHDGVRT